MSEGTGQLLGIMAQRSQWKRKAQVPTTCYLGRATQNSKALLGEKELSLFPVLSIPHGTLQNPPRKSECLRKTQLLAQVDVIIQQWAHHSVNQALWLQPANILFNRQMKHTNTQRKILYLLNEIVPSLFMSTLLLTYYPHNTFFMNPLAKVLFRSHLKPFSDQQGAVEENIASLSGNLASI